MSLTKLTGSIQFYKGFDHKKLRAMNNRRMTPGGPSLFTGKPILPPPWS